MAKDIVIHNAGEQVVGSPVVVRRGSHGYHVYRDTYPIVEAMDTVSALVLNDLLVEASGR